MSDQPVTWFDEKRNEWVRSDGTPVCQDHGHPIASCPFHRKD